MMKKCILLLMTAASALSACENETALRKSIFKLDPQSDGLPVYSELGYNTFGAYFDRQIFVSNHNEVPLKITQVQGKTSFIFTGEKRGLSSGYSDLFSIAIVVSNSQLETYHHLLRFDNKTLDLTDESVKVVVSDPLRADTVEIIEGEFKFLRAKDLLVDQNSQGVIVSGVFEFQALVRGVPVSITNGRFDAGVSEFNFFRY